MSNKNGIAQVDKPVQLTWRNRRVRSKENEKGEFFYITEFEFDEEAWGYLKTIPSNANGEMVIWVTDVGLVTEKPKKPKEKGPHGKLWRELFLDGFVACPGVKEAIEAIRETEYEKPWEDLLHRLFGVGGASLAVISPEDIYARFPKEQFPQVQTMVEQAKRKANKQ